MTPTSDDHTPVIQTPTLQTPTPWYLSKEGIIAFIAVAAISLSLALRYSGSPTSNYSNYPLFIAYIFGGVPIVIDLSKKLLRKEFSNDLLAGVSIVTALFLSEYLAGTFVILMLSGGEALEVYALRRASSVLNALAKRMPNIARLRIDGSVREIALSEVQPGDELQILPHDICPVDGEVIDGFGTMDESFLTGEPYQMQKAPGSGVISGAINGESVLVIKATSHPADSRYQRIAKVIEEQASKQVPMKRLGDRLGAFYGPMALGLAVLAWSLSGEAERFLAVILAATPCPLLIAIPVALIGTISRAASRGIIIKNPAVLEQLSNCKIMILDKTGTLTYGKPLVTDIHILSETSEDEILGKVAALETYSKHPLAEAIIQAAKSKNISLPAVTSVSERPGQGLTGLIMGKTIAVTSRKKIGDAAKNLPDPKQGLECIITEDGLPVAVISFKDIPRKESRSFISHVPKYHGIESIKILSGDRLSEVQHLADLVGITEVEAGLSPEEKLERVKRDTAFKPTVYIGDGINDAPALQAATVGIAVGINSDITSEAADAVILEPSLIKVDELFHLSHRLRSIALQSAIGGMAFSIFGMGFAAFGMLTPLAGAILQELIDVVAVLNALRTAFSPKVKHHSL